MVKTKSNEEKTSNLLLPVFLISIILVTSILVATIHIAFAKENTTTPTPGPTPNPTPGPTPCPDNMTLCDGGGPKKHHHNGGSFSSTTTSSKHSGLIQIPSNKTDYPNNDPSVIQVHALGAKKNILGDYEITGEVTNVGNDTLQFVQITAHLYDATGQLVGSGFGYTTPTNLDAQHTGTYDIFVTKDSLNGKPTSYRLSYDWS